MGISLKAKALKRMGSSWEHRATKIIDEKVLESVRQKLLLRRSLTFSVIFFAFVYPIIHANAYYLDDYYRTASGSIAFAGVGRPLAGVVMGIISLHHWFIFDVAPLPQILSAVFLSVTLSILSFVLVDITEATVVLSLSFVFCSFWFLQNLSYRYDSLTMSLAICLALLPFVLRKVESIVCIFLNCLCVILCLDLYQPAINAFLVFAFFSFIYNMHPGNVGRSVKVLFFRIVSCGIGLILYKFQMLIVSPTGYGARHSATTLSPYVGAHNIVLFSTYAYELAFSTRQSTVVFLVFFLVSMCAILTNLYEALWVRKSYIHFFMLLAGFFGLLLCAAGPMLFLKSPVLVPRVMIGFSVLFSAISVLAFQKVGKIIRKLLVAMLLFSLFSQFSLSFAYGNGLKLSSRSGHYIARGILENVSKLSAGRKVALLIEGREPQLSGVRNIDRQLPIMTKLLPAYLDGINKGGAWQLNFWNFGRPLNVVTNLREARKIEALARDRKPDGQIRTSIYVLRRYGKYMILRFLK